jgi:single-stranded-DNA-specific exonuclease
MKKMNLDEIQRVLENRFTDDSFTTLKELPPPHLFKDMQKATKRIAQAIKNNETINIIGDYDADGVISTTIMVSFFKDALGINVNYIIPNRFTHGYGLSPKIVDLIQDGIIITVDNGISSYEAATLCKKKGLDLIITDHHTVGVMKPDAYAIINPKQEECEFPFSDICGANVAWYLCANIKKELGLEYDLSSLLDLLAIAIVADVMPMKSLNKALVKKGFQKLQTSNRVAFVVLKERFGLSSINEIDIGFRIAPLINCAGRMEDGSLALEFLLSNTKEEANQGLEYLIYLNEKRKQEQLSIFEEAKLQVKNEDSVIVVASDEWNEGIIGIVASKLCEKYKKPSFVFKDRGEYLKGSARSLGDIHLYDLIDLTKESTLGFGGHKGAAGLSVAKEQFDDFKQAVNLNSKKIFKNKIEDELFASIDLTLVDRELYTLIESFRPYGLENRLPLFQFENIFIKEVRKIGAHKQYQKLKVSNGFKECDLLIFSDEEEQKVGDKISFSATIEQNIFRDRVSYNLLLKEIYK